MRRYTSFSEFTGQGTDRRYFYVTTRGKRCYTEFAYQPGDFIIFGRESTGLPQELIDANPGMCMRIPMVGGVRSLNLSNSVAVVVYEGMRKQMFRDMS